MGRAFFSAALQHARAGCVFTASSNEPARGPPCYTNVVAHATELVAMSAKEPGRFQTIGRSVVAASGVAVVRRVLRQSQMGVLMRGCNRTANI
jgi:hypothetical protein